MSDVTQYVDAHINATNITYEDDSSTLENSQADLYVRITGIVISSLCLILQLVLYIIRPKIRKLDQKILTQLTVARMMNSVMEMCMTYQYFHEYYTKDLTNY
ncbi:unnamed protein product [Spodoptera exigua]|nr:unnamed protein product [Spodoptera exigua]